MKPSKLWFILQHCTHPACNSNGNCCGPEDLATAGVGIRTLLLLEIRQAGTASGPGPDAGGYVLSRRHGGSESPARMGISS